MIGIVSEQPPGYGSFELTFPFGLVSLQASVERKSALQAKVTEHLPDYKFLLSGDVSVEVEWRIRERSRYESAHTTDIDNTLKPLIDALTGPTGIMINDTQLQHVACSWIDWTREKDEIQVRFRFSPDEYLPKDGLAFVRMPDSPLCFPYNEKLPPEHARALLDFLENGWTIHRRGLEVGVPDEISRYVLPAQRFFHGAHLKQFKVLSLGQARAALA